MAQHIRKRRLELHLMQVDLGDRIGVHGTSVQNWERGVTEPAIRYLPGIIEFLGYDPMPEPSALAARIAYARRRLGWTQERLAAALNIDTVTVYRWEKGDLVPSVCKIGELQTQLGSRFILTDSAVAERET